MSAIQIHSYHPAMCGAHIYYCTSNSSKDRNCLVYSKHSSLLLVYMTMNAVPTFLLLSWEYQIKTLKYTILILHIIPRVHWSMRIELYYPLSNICSRNLVCKRRALPPGRMLNNILACSSSITYIYIFIYTCTVYIIFANGHAIFTRYNYSGQGTLTY